MRDEIGRSYSAVGKTFSPSPCRRGLGEGFEHKTRDFLARSGAKWNVAGPIIGALVTHYFGPQRDAG
jgi:hypothetical protein